MSRESFEMVLSKIVGHKAFNLHGKTPQADPRLQLVICAYRFGSSGSSASVGNIARRFGVSEGFAPLDVSRLLSVEGSVFNWPAREERTTIKARTIRESGFPDCVGMLDGTLVLLKYKSTKDGEDYWSYKSRYGISAMVVCDDKREIRYMFIGICGSAHDI
ncbi:hypothetical protein RvY_10844 [Ramazzottius varieornatus]|uniref:Uncharacterized protein n=1 Tax=Ramazzottius varieornatus TaxID=947166 RepID=A0A1D1VE41_RAMVA|nr:hypothetical protein RvY_10844 [Ramazzottius varieornatus]